MRRALLLSLPLLPLLHFACVSDDPGSPAGLDASVPGLDGGTAEGGSLPDVVTPLPDTFVPDGGPSAVNVRVTHPDKTPVENVHVIFHDKAGAVLDEKTTQNAGVVSAFVPAGSQVTVVLGTPTQPRLVTITDVEPGDNLLAIDTSPIENLANSKLVSVDSVTPGAPVGTMFYEVSVGGCTSTTGSFPTNISLIARCVGAGTVPIVVRAVNDGNSTEGFAYQKNVNLLDAGVPDGAAADSGLLSVNVSGAWQDAAVGSQNVSATNAPDSGYMTMTFSELVSGVALPQTAYPDMDGGQADASFIAHPAFADALQSETFIVGRVGTGVSYNGVAVREGASLSGSRTHDLSQLLPKIDDAGIEDGGALRPIASWTSSASLAGADGAIVQMGWNEAIDGGYVYGTWTFVVPPTATSVTPPVLPAAYQAYAPSATSYVYQPPVVTVVEASFIKDYSELRQLAGSLPPSEGLINDNGTNLTPPLPADGTVKMSAFTRNGD